MLNKILVLDIIFTFLILNGNVLFKFQKTSRKNISLFLYLSIGKNHLFNEINKFRVNPRMLSEIFYNGKFSLFSRVAKKNYFSNAPKMENTV